VGHEILSTETTLEELALTDAELFDRSVIDMADSFMPADGWSIGPDDPELRTHLIESELFSEVFADAVIAKMRELGAARRLL
jgi:hypothetical protein